MLAALFTFPGLNLSPVLLIVVGIGAYLLLRKFAGPTVANNVAGTALEKLVPRIGNLTRFVDALGLPFLMPLLQTIAQGKLLDVPAQANAVLDQLDDKTQRQSILANLAKRQLRDQLADPAKREPLLAEIEQILGVKIDRQALPASVPLSP